MTPSLALYAWSSVDIQLNKVFLVTFYVQYHQHQCVVPQSK